MASTSSSHVPPVRQSTLDPALAVRDAVVAAGEPWLARISKGQVLRIVDLEGNQAVDTLFFNAHDAEERYSATNTILAQRALYLGLGTTLVSSEGRPMLTIVADTCGRHDTLGGACSCGEQHGPLRCSSKRSMHSLPPQASSKAQCNGRWRPARRASRRRDLTANINFFMNVPVTPDGKLTFEDGVSDAGKYVELQAPRWTPSRCVISNCPQLNNPCNAYNPTPVRCLVWDAR